MHWRPLLRDLAKSTITSSAIKSNFISRHLMHEPCEPLITLITVDTEISRQFDLAPCRKQIQVPCTVVHHAGCLHPIRLNLHAAAHACGPKTPDNPGGGSFLRLTTHSRTDRKLCKQGQHQLYGPRKYRFILTLKPGPARRGLTDLTWFAALSKTRPNMGSSLQISNVYYITISILIYGM